MKESILLFLIVLVVCVLLLVGMILLMMRVAKFAGGVQRGKRSKTAMTEYGEFEKIGPMWVTEIFHELKTVQIFVKDAKGEPSRDRLLMLPQAIERLEELEMQARKAIPALGSSFELASISLLEVQGEDFSLNFDSEQSEHGIAAYFKEMSVIGYSLDD